VYNISNTTVITVTNDTKGYWDVQGDFQLKGSNTI